eukprot:m51a1_g473 hypothetical protein (647) ;mRNA; r:193513-195872
MAQQPQPQPPDSCVVAEAIVASDLSQSTDPAASAERSSSSPESSPRTPRSADSAGPLAAPAAAPAAPPPQTAPGQAPAPPAGPAQAAGAAGGAQGTKVDKKREKELQKQREREKREEHRRQKEEAKLADRSMKKEKEAKAKDAKAPAPAPPAAAAAAPQEERAGDKEKKEKESKDKGKEERGKDKDKSKDKTKEKDKEKEKEKEKPHKQEKEKDKSKGKDKEKEKEHKDDKIKDKAKSKSADRGLEARGGPAEPSSTAVFGVGVDVAARRSDGDDWMVPAPLRDAITFLSRNNRVASEGLYRVPGSFTFVKALRADYDSGKRWHTRGEAAATPFGEFQQDEAASIVLGFFNSLPKGESIWEPARDALEDAATLVDSSSGDPELLALAADAFNKAFALLTAPKRETLRVVLPHLAQVAAAGTQNKMSAATIGICFGGSFRRMLPVLIAASRGDPTLGAVLGPQTIVFGVPLEEAARRSPGGLIPSPVRVCADFIDARALDEELLYVSGGLHRRVLEARFELNSGKAPVFAATEGCEAASVMMRFWSECHPSVFDEAQSAALVAACSGAHVETGEPADEAKFAVVQEVVRSLGPVASASLSFFVKHLNRVVEHKARNKVSLRLLTSVMGPTWSKIFPVLLCKASVLFP